MRPVLRIYPMGVSVATAGNPNPRNTFAERKRGKVKDWSRSSGYRYRAKLMRVEPKRLPRVSVSSSLTVRDVPRDLDAFNAQLKVFRKRVERLGGWRCGTYVKELQRRGALHVHGFDAFDVDHSQAVRVALAVRGHWLEVMAEWRPSAKGQHVVGRCSGVGWFAYLASHASGARAKEQRDAGRLPAGTIGGLGRVWGWRGDWPTADPSEFREGGAWYIGFDGRTYREVFQAVAEVAARDAERFDPGYAEELRRRAAASHEWQVGDFRNLSYFMGRDAFLDAFALAEHGALAERPL